MTEEIETKLARHAAAINHLQESLETMAAKLLALAIRVERLEARE